MVVRKSKLARREKAPETCIPKRGGVRPVASSRVDKELKVFEGIGEVSPHTHYPRTRPGIKHTAWSITPRPSASSYRPGTVPIYSPVTLGARDKRYFSGSGALHGATIAETVGKVTDVLYMTTEKAASHLSYHNSVWESP